MNESFLARPRHPPGGQPTMVPILEPDAWPAFLTILQACQSQLIADPDCRELVLNFDPSQRDLLEKFCCLRAIAEEDDFSSSTYPLFNQEVWYEGGAEGRLRLALRSQTPELILGVMDRQARLLQVLQDRQQLPERLLSRPYLTVPRQLPGPDPLHNLLWSRLLRRSSSGQSTYITSIDQLFEGIELDVSKGTGSTFVRRLRLLAKVGAALQEQGVVLETEAVPGTIFKGNDLSFEHLVWNLEPNSMWLAKRERFLAVASDSLFRRCLAPEIRELIRVFAPQSELPILESALGPIKERVLSEGVAPESFPCSDRNSGLVLHPFGLYVELVSRWRQTDPDFGVAAGVKNLFSMAAKPDTESFDQWLNLWRDRGSELREILEREHFSISQLKVAGNLHLITKMKSRLHADTVVILDSKNELPMEPIQPVPDDVPMERRTPMESLFDPLGSILRPQKRGEGKGAVKQALTPHSGDKASLRRLAESELKTLRLRDPDAYQSLRTDFMSSLSKESRKTLVELQQRMSAQDFKAQLDQRLVKHMVENPASWRTGAKSPPQRRNYGIPLDPHFGQF